ncbi:hypothetical protein TNCV_3253151 [Trichonephila clavipes]|nr:hypothetical protein TNCV_3253151 [Trichonephila clavipes]
MSFQESFKTVANRWNFHYIQGLERDWFDTMEKKLQYSQSLEKQLTETKMKLNSIYDKMLSDLDLDYENKMTTLQNPTILDEHFFEWVRKGVQQLKNELDATRKQLVLAIENPSNYEVTEVDENLPAICGADSELKQERDQLTVERDRLKEENNQLKAERNQLKEEKGQLWKENDQLKETRDTFWKETEILRNEKNALKTEIDQLSKGNDLLRKENHELKMERDQWKERWMDLEYELKQEKYRSVEHCNASKKDLEVYHRECKKLVDPFKIQTFVTEVQTKYSLTEDVYKNIVKLLNSFQMTLTTPDWPQEIISKFKQLERMKGKYETLFADHEEMQNKYEKDLHRIVKDNNTQQNQLKQ